MRRSLTLRHAACRSSARCRPRNSKDLARGRSLGFFLCPRLFGTNGNKVVLRYLTDEDAHSAAPAVERGAVRINGAGNAPCMLPLRRRGPEQHRWDLQ